MGPKPSVEERLRLVLGGTLTAVLFGDSDGGTMNICR